VLVVDDIPMFRDLMANFLAGTGRVLTASGGREALEIARAEQPRLIISDFDMPDLGGVDLCRAVRADATLQRTRFLMILPGSEDDARDRVRSIRAGADDVISKPIQRPELVQTVRRFLAADTVRGLPRVPVSTPVTIYLSKNESEGKALNVSRGGMFVATDLPLPTHSEWRVRFHLPETDAQLTPTAMVVWRAPEDAPTGPGLGMRFVELDGPAARTLDEYVYERTPTSQMPIPQP
jgi:uncharacterized protein (TIGR02266 family)